jgi:uncharacterized membrane protein HdeD (DUF308 family)
MLVGVVLLFIPLATSAAVTFLVGWSLIIGGAIMAIGSVVAARQAGMSWVNLIVGLLAFGAGILLASNLLEGTMTLTAIVILWLLIDGVVGSIASVATRPDGWGVMLTASLVSLTLGLLLWADWPTSATWLLGIYAGAVLLLRGLGMVASGVMLRRAGA